MSAQPRDDELKVHLHFLVFTSLALKNSLNLLGQDYGGLEEVVGYK
jgi:hypothetical protein